MCGLIDMKVSKFKSKLKANWYSLPVNMKYIIQMRFILYSVGSYLILLIILAPNHLALPLITATYHTDGIFQNPSLLRKHNVK